MEYWIPLILITAAGGVVQTMAGFGCGLVMMLVFPYLMPLTKAAALNSIAGGVLSLALVIRYRSFLKPRFVLLTAVPYLIASITILHFVGRIDTRALAVMFGIFLTVLGLYYLCFSSRARMPVNPLTLFVCPVVSGLSSGLFGIGGPLMSLLYLEKYDSREAYAVNLNLLFLISAMINTATRTVNGIIDGKILVPALVCGAAILLGERIGLFLTGRMKPELLRKTVYIMVLISGIVLIINNLGIL